MWISEVFGSIQGEGLYSGTPSAFVRTSGCNLRCWFCDTPETSWRPRGTHREWESLVEEVEEDWREELIGTIIEGQVHHTRITAEYLGYDLVGCVDPGVPCRPGNQGRHEPQSSCEENLDDPPPAPLAVPGWNVRSYRRSCLLYTSDAADE